jgi:TPR repeat protein
MQGNGKIERDYSKARSLFERSIKLDDKDSTANYNLGLLCMLGLGQEDTKEKDITKAMSYFDKISDKDPAAMNAIGVLYYQAPDLFETDPVKLHGWGGLKRDIKKSWKFLEKSATKGSLHANFNLGALHLDPNDKENFSLSKAYEKFKVAAMAGHTISSYNVGVMHFLGLGTFKSCQVSIAFFKHVLQVGE